MEARNYAVNSKLMPENNSDKPNVANMDDKRPSLPHLLVGNTTPGILHPMQKSGQKQTATNSGFKVRDILHNASTSKQVPPSHDEPPKKLPKPNQPGIRITETINYQLMDNRPAPSTFLGRHPEGMTLYSQSGTPCTYLPTEVDILNDQKRAQQYRRGGGGGGGKRRTPSTTVPSPKAKSNLHYGPSGIAPEKMLKTPLDFPQFIGPQLRQNQRAPIQERFMDNPVYQSITPASTPLSAQNAHIPIMPAPIPNLTSPTDDRLGTVYGLNFSPTNFPGSRDYRPSAIRHSSQGRDSVIDRSPTNGEPSAQMITTIKLEGDVNNFNSYKKSQLVFLHLVINMDEYQQLFAHIIHVADGAIKDIFSVLSRCLTFPKLKVEDLFTNFHTVFALIAKATTGNIPLLLWRLCKDVHDILLFIQENFLVFVSSEFNNAELKLVDLPLRAELLKNMLRKMHTTRKNIAMPGQHKFFQYVESSQGLMASPQNAANIIPHVTETLYQYFKHFQKPPNQLPPHCFPPGSVQRMPVPIPPPSFPQSCFNENQHLNTTDRIPSTIADLAHSYCTYEFFKSVSCRQNLFDNLDLEDVKVPVIEIDDDVPQPDAESNTLQNGADKAQSQEPVPAIPPLVPLPSPSSVIKTTTHTQTQHLVSNLAPIVAPESSPRSPNVPITNSSQKRASISNKTPDETEQSAATNHEDLELNTPSPCQTEAWPSKRERTYTNDSKSVVPATTSSVTTGTNNN